METGATLFIPNGGSGFNQVFFQGGAAFVGITMKGHQSLGQGLVIQTSVG